ncbi:response regulator [Brevundimonas sp.]|uniref:response regulator n=1 Tax=Brevundimonas sp. TaxID=1871086 RepID=UPI002D2DB78B|nr:response regulator [Brevundimonas sp.]HYD27278.1 response regulator [Brevundimonas sp.]
MAVIVVVDDDPTIQMIASELLREGNHAVVCAADGNEALRVLASMPVDLVVMDMLMPNKDGLETIIEARELYPDLRILAISSGGRVGVGDLLRMARIFGADDTYVKPLRLDTFAATIDRMLAEPRQAVDIMVAEAT